MTGRRMVKWVRFFVICAAVLCLGALSGAGVALGDQAQAEKYQAEGNQPEGNQTEGNQTEGNQPEKNQPEKNQPDKNQDQRLYDDAGLMMAEDEKELEELIAQCRKKTGMDVAVVTAYNDGIRTAMEYADDFYDQNGMGTGKKASGVLFLIYMDSPDSYGGESYVSTSGNMIRILTDKRIERIQDDVAYSLRGRDYAGAAAKFLEDVEYYVDRGIQRGQYNYDTQTGEISIYRSIRWYEGLFAFLAAAAVAGSACLGVKAQYSMEKTKREKANGLMAYRADSKFIFGNTGDRLVKKYVTSVPIPRITHSSSSGGSGHGSGRSSTHRSSGGGSHGGGGRRF